MARSRLATDIRRCLSLHAVRPLRAALGRRTTEGFGILMYHRVVDATNRPLPRGTIDRRRFRDQLAGLLRRGFRPVALSEVAKRHAAGEAVPPRAFIVTFDDGYECLYETAWPVLQDLGVPATVFLVTSHLDRPNPMLFDDWLDDWRQRCPAAWGRSLTLDQCRRMQAAGLIEFGTHTHTHRRFAEEPQTFAGELGDSLAVLRNELGVERPPLAYPFGYWTSEMAQAARQCGSPCALTTEPRSVSPGDDRFSWGRFEVESYDTAGTLAVKLDGWYTWSLRLWQRLRGKGPPR